VAPGPRLQRDRPLHRARSGGINTRIGRQIPPTRTACYREINVPHARRNPPAAGDACRTLSAELRSVEKFKTPGRKESSAPRSPRRPRHQRQRRAVRPLLLEITTGIPVSLAAPSIATLYEARVDYRDALVVGISQSGESTDTNLVLERARRQGALTLGITNESGSALARIAEHVLLVRAAAKRASPPPRPTPARCS